MLRACIIGVSGFGEVHYHDLMREVARGRMCAAGAVVINPGEEKAKVAELERLGCAVFSSHEAMFAALRGRIDLCFIPTGIHLHAPMAQAAMRAGAHVLLEKPAAALIQDLRAMQACEAETGRRVAVGYQHYYGPDVEWMAGLIASGALGRLASLKCRALWPRLDSYYQRNGWAGRLRTARGEWVLDSPFNNALAHPLNLMACLAGSPPVSVQAELYRAHAIESADTACIRARTASGASLLFLASHASEAELDPEVTIRGEKGELRWNFQGARFGAESMPCAGDEPLRDRILDQLHTLAAGGQARICGLEEASGQTLIANGAHESSPVHAIPAAGLRRFEWEGSVKTVAEGIDAWILKAYAQEALFSELGVPWARPGKEFSLAGYARYPSREEGA